MDTYDEIEMKRKLDKLDKIDELVTALEDISEELVNLAGSLDAFTHELVFIKRIKGLIEIYEVETKEVNLTDRNRFNYWVGVKAIADRKLAEGVVELVKEVGLVVNTK